MKKAFLFVGQGAQKPGMGIDLVQENACCRAVFECASDILGFDLESVCREADAETLSETTIAQPGIMAVSLAATALLAEHGFNPACVAGHSLGEYAGMVCAGIVSMEDGFRIIKARAQEMARLAEAQKGAMCAIIGVDADEIETVCAGISGLVMPVNYNSPLQTVIAGEQTAVNAAVDVLSAKARRCQFLNVSAAFHTEMMAPAAEAFAAQIDSIAFHEPKIPFYSNITGERLTNISDMPALLARHMISPVCFVKELKQMEKDGFDAYVELGPGKVLTGLVRKTLPNATTFSVQDSVTFHAFEKAMC